MKQRFSYLDLRLITNEVEAELTNCYLQNVYSLENSPRHFLFKFDAGVHQSGKQYLMVDPGMRYHFTQYQHEPTKQPSHFVQKLRRYLKNKRATNFWVAAASRLMVITFAEGQFFLVFEFFAGGNLILLDKDHQILTLFRVVREVGPGQQNYLIGEHYNLSMETSELSSLQSPPSLDQLQEWVQRDKLGKTLYSKISDPSSSLIEYCLRQKGLDPKQKLSPETSDGQLHLVREAVVSSLDWAHTLIKHTPPTPGYILYDGQNNSLEFEPFKEYFETVHPGYRIEEVSSYNGTVDKYFGAILSDKSVNKVEQLHALADTRLAAARNERQKRVEGLTLQQEENLALGNKLLEHASVVESAIGAVKALLDQGADWGDAENLIKIEQQKGNNVANVIHSLQLHKGQVTLSLDDKKIPVQVDRSAYANARDYFEVRRNALLKMEKTEQHANKALKSAELKIKRDLASNLDKHRQAGVAAQLHAIRKPHWFEKFWWFLTSTGHLVIAARDEMQRDQLLRRYFFEGDLAISSDAPEATVLILKNPGGTDVPPQALLQASAFCVATSAKAWESKAKSPSWFITRKQLPKINREGDPISVRDLFAVKSRQLVPPTPLEMGFALLWQQQSDVSETGADTGATNSENEDDNDSKNGEAEEEDDENFPDTQFESDEELSDAYSNSDSDDDSSEETRSDKESSEDPEDLAAERTSDSAEEGASVGAAEEPVQSRPPAEKGSSDAPNDQADAIELNRAEPTTPLAPATDTLQSSNNSLVSTQSSPEPQLNAGQPKKVRGSKKKMRKYLQQDEEERQEAMERLGTMKGLQRKAQEQDSRQQARAREQALLKQRKDRRRQAELAHIAESESKPEQQPLPTDLEYQFKDDESIVAAVPMFAPWTSIQKAQYKIKLVPGSMKKGKASSEILKVILKSGTKPAGSTEQKLVDGIRQVDAQQAIAVSKVQLATSVASAKSAKQDGGKGKSTGRKKK